MLDRAALEQETAAPAPLPALWTVHGLYSDPSLSTFPVEVVPHLARRGCTTLFAGGPKLGKTTLVMNALAAHANDTDFLGGRVTARGWLWLALDEPEPIMIPRLRGLGVPEHTDRVRFLLRRDLDRKFTPAVLAHYLEETGADVVVLDTLGRIAQAHGINISKGDELLPWLTPYIEVIRKTNVAAIILAHTTKDGLTYKGAVELEGEVDAPLLFKRRGERDEAGEDTAETSTLRRLEGMTRWGEVAVDLSSPDGLHYVLGDGNLSFTDRVLSALRASDLPTPVAMLAKRLGRRKQDVQSELAELADRGLARRGRNGWTAGRPMLAVPAHLATDTPDREPDRDDTPRGTVGSAPDHARTAPDRERDRDESQAVPRSRPRGPARDRVAPTDVPASPRLVRVTMTTGAVEVMDAGSPDLTDPNMLPLIARVDPIEDAA